MHRSSHKVAGLCLPLCIVDHVWSVQPVAGFLCSFSL